MSARDQFGDHRGPRSKIKQKFEMWLKHRGYEACSDMYPAALQAAALVDEYLQEYPNHECDRSIIEHHAEGIGWISDYQKEETDDEDGNEADDPDIW